MSVTPGIRKKVEKLMDSAPNSFEQSMIIKVSTATAPLASWVQANVKYSEVLLKIEPLTNELNGLTNKLQKFQVRVEECQQ